MVAEIRDQISVVDDLVRVHARTISFSVSEYERMSERLRQVRLARAFCWLLLLGRVCFWTVMCGMEVLQGRN